MQVNSFRNTMPVMTKQNQNKASVSNQTNSQNPNFGARLNLTNSVGKKPIATHFFNKLNKLLVDTSNELNKFKDEVINVKAGYKPDKECKHISNYVYSFYTESGELCGEVLYNDVCKDGYRNLIGNEYDPKFKYLEEPAKKMANAIFGTLEELQKQAEEVAPFNERYAAEALKK